MIKLTTPATASAPYTAEAPPVTTSTRSMSVAGTKFRSGAVLLGLPEGVPMCRRRPSISTRVRLARRPRRSTVAVPVAPLEMAEPWEANTCGSWFTRSSVRVMPRIITSWEPTVVTGLTLSRLGDGMRVPVTTTSATSSAPAAAWATAGPAAVSVRPQIIDDAMRRARTDWLFTIVFPPQITDHSVDLHPQVKVSRPPSGTR